VTRHNFAAVLPVVREALQSCDFFAIDCEMTGLFLEGGNGNGGGANGRGALFLDDIEDRYEEVSESKGEQTGGRGRQLRQPTVRVARRAACTDLGET
jgi:hypothetical protein